MTALSLYCSLGRNNSEFVGKDRSTVLVSVEFIYNM